MEREKTGLLSNASAINIRNTNIGKLEEE